jgi:hypothetical protein
MNVFLSWSGRASHDVAMVLRKWLPYMLHSIRPFMSSVDIAKGERWSDELSSELKSAQYGIICVTPFNIHKPWMNFEAGSLARLPHLTPFLFRVDRLALGQSPLTQFQLIEFGRDDDHNKSEFQKLIEDINREGSAEERLDPEVLATNFDYWWSKLVRDFERVPESSEGETRTAYKWLRTFEDLAIHDPEPDCDKVWFVTPDIFKYALRTGVREKMEANLKKIEYRYLLPEPDGSNERAARDQLENLKRTYAGRLDYRCFKREVFEKQATSDYVIVESSTPDSTSIKVFVRIPIADSSAEYWFDTDERAAIGFYHRFMQLWNASADVVTT